MSNIKTGYHFTKTTLRNGRPIPPIGEWLEYKGDIVPCDRGLHMSEHPYDALGYAPGTLLHRVELSGDIITHGNPVDKLVGRKRRIIATIDAKRMLHEYAIWCAESVLHIWEDWAEINAPEHKNAPRVALETKRLWLNGDATDKELENARAAAWAAARDAAAGAAARAAAWAAAWAAAETAAETAAEDAAWDAQRAKFAEMVDAEFATAAPERGE